MPIPLVERSEREIAAAVRQKVKALKDVKGCHEVRVHVTGKRIYVEMHVLLDSKLTFENTHRIAMEIEDEVKKLVPQARVTILTEPSGNGRESIWELVKLTAEAVPGSRGVHNIHIQNIDNKLCVDLHMEVSANMTVKQAHDVSDEVEKRLRAANPDFSEITIHVETASEHITRESTGIESELEPFIEDVARSFPEIRHVHGIRITRTHDGLHVALQCHFDPDITMKKVHEISSRLENIIRTTQPKITRIDIHEEPD